MRELVPTYLYIYIPTIYACRKCLLISARTIGVIGDVEVNAQRGELVEHEARLLQICGVVEAETTCVQQRHVIHVPVLFWAFGCSMCMDELITNISLV